MVDSKPDNDGVVAFPPGVFALALLIGFLIGRALPLSLVPVSMAAALRGVGIAAFAIGAIAILAAGLRFWRLRTTPGHWTPTTAIASDGLYGYTRNPMYVGMALCHAGVALWANSLWMLIMLLPALWTINTQVIAREEAYLEEKFGESYRTYKQRVRRWL